MFFFLPGCKSTAKQKTTHPFELTWAVIKTLVMVHYAGCLKGILITAYFNLYTTGWHNPQCLYIRYIYLTQPTRTSSSKGSLSDTNPNFIHHYQKKSPQILPYMSGLFDLPPKCFPIEFHPTITLPSTPACPAITRLLITSAGVAQIEATKPLQQALRVWTAVPYFWSALVMGRIWGGWMFFLEAMMMILFQQKTNI